MKILASRLLRPLLATLLLASAASCGLDPDVPESGDTAVDEQPLGAIYTLSCLPPGTDR